MHDLGIPRDFTTSGKLGYIHRRTPEADLYFVANPEPYGQTTVCTFRVFGKRPERWNPETGERTPVAIYAASAQGTSVYLAFGPSESAFIVFRESVGADDSVIALARDGEVLAGTRARVPRIRVTEARYGVSGDPGRSRDVRDLLQQRINAGNYTLPVAELVRSGDPAENVVKTLRARLVVDGEAVTLQGRDMDTVHLDYAGPCITVIRASYGVPGDPARTRDVREKLQRLLDTGRDAFRVAEMAEGDDPAYGVVKTLDGLYEIDGDRFPLHGLDPDTLKLYLPEGETPGATLRRGAGEALVLETAQAGRYDIAFASGRTTGVTVPEVPPAMSVTGPWSLRFPEGWGAPEAVTLDRLVSWSDHGDPGVRHFSGTGTYRSTFVMPGPFPGRQVRRYLDLGDVRVMARVTLNGRDLGILWKPPFRVEVTDVLKAGENTLEIAVTNLWVNRMIGDEGLPEDSARNQNGTLKEWPAWLKEGKPGPTGRFTFTTWRLWGKNDKPQPSGLLGPVVVTAERVMEID